MRGSENAKALLLLLAAWLFPLPCYAGQYGVAVENAQLLKKDRAYVLDADIAYRLPPKVITTVQNGIPLVWALHVQVHRQRRYLWDECVVDVLRRYFVRYHALMNVYQVRDENRGEENNFSSLQAALEAVGTIRDLPLPELRDLAGDARYRARIKMQLDREALPLPLRPLSYIRSNWYLSSGWYSWPVQK
jgi:hypothetical protein